MWYLKVTDTFDRTVFMMTMDNDGYGTPEVGHYDVWYYAPSGEGIRSARVENFHRARGVEALGFEAMKALRFDQEEAPDEQQTSERQRA